MLPIGTYYHKHLGKVIITDFCLFLQARNPDPSSIFVMYGTELREVTKELLHSDINYWGK